MVNLDIVKSMTDMCSLWEAGHILNKNKSLKRNGSVPGECDREEVDQNHPMTTHHRGAEEARRAHNPKDG